MEDVSSSTDLSASLNDPVDAVADLLGGGSEANDDVIEDSVDEETQTDESTEDDESSEVEAEGTDEGETTEESDEEDGDWAAVLGVDEEKLDFDEEGNFAGVNVKVNGESSKVSMGDLISGYQNAKSFTQKSQVLAEERKAFEQGMANESANYQAKIQQVEQLSDYLGKQLTSEYDNVNWEQLRYENPAEYAALRQDYATKANEIQKAQGAIQQEKQQQSEQQNALSQQNQQAYLAEQRDVMISNNPNWSDSSVFQEDMSTMKSFMGNQYGFSDGDFSQVYDARLIEVMKDAKAYREGVKVAKAKIKKPVPKFQKSVGKQRKQVSKLDKLTNRAKNTTGSNQRDNQVDAIAELMSGL